MTIKCILFDPTAAMIKFASQRNKYEFHSPPESRGDSFLPL